MRSDQRGRHRQSSRFPRYHSYANILNCVLRLQRYPNIIELEIILLCLINFVYSQHIIKAIFTVEISPCYLTDAPSMVRKTDETVRSYNGHAASFFCEVSAVPAPTWTWTKPDGSAVLVDSERYFIETTENGLKSSLKVLVVILLRSRNVHSVNF